MFWKLKYKKAFYYWQNKAPMHPLTCSNGCGNLDLEYIDKNNILHLYCKHCDYKQKYIPDLIYNYYKHMLEESKIKIKLFFRWFDLWIGIFIDIENDAIYIIPIPMLGIKIWRVFKNPFDELFNKTI